MPTSSGPPPEGITDLLQAWRGGDAAALEALIARVYPQLRRIAQAHFRRERAGLSLEPQEILHEAFLRLADAGEVEWRDRTHFFAVASRVMRRVLVDHARRRGRRKRAGERVTLREVDAAAQESPVDVLAVDQALERMQAAGFAQEVEVVQLRFFAGLTIEEVASCLGLGHATVSRLWTFARTWLHRELSGEQR